MQLAGLDVPEHAPARAVLERIETVSCAPGTRSGRRLHRYRRGWRARESHAGQPSCSNFGYQIENVLYHPGDTLALPSAQVRALLVPLQASWLKTAEAVEFVRAVAPRHATGIHDGQVNERGLDSLNSWLAQEYPGYAWSPPGSIVPTAVVDWPAGRRGRRTEHQAGVDKAAQDPPGPAGFEVPVRRGPVA